MIGSTPLLLAQTESAPSAPAAPPPPVLPEGETAAPAAGNGDATTGAVDPNGQPLGNGGGGGPGGIDPFTLIMLAGVVLLFVFMFSGQRKEKKKRQAMLAAMTKGDRVQTVGGVLGTITEIKDDEITLKVDENSNTRMRFARNAIQSVIQDKPE